jgi:hypothetical protein
MKTIVKIIICATLAALPSIGFAQLGYSGPTDLDVNGIFIGGKYTKAQVTAKWGTSTQYRSSMSENGLNEVYDYSSNQFLFGENGVFHSLYINTPNFVFDVSNNGGLKVGDDISRVNALKWYYVDAPLLIEADGEGVLNVPSDDYINIGYSKGKITWISFVSSV